jgi:uncharacterized protein YbjT (DUF2867 family)
MIAVMGASGNVGSRVSDRLLQNGQDVRVFGRSRERLEALGQRGAEIVVGDASNLDDLRTLFSGVAAALVVLPDNVADPSYVANRSAMSRAITRALREQRVGHVVLASSVGAHQERGVGQIGGLHELEELLFGLEDANVLSLRAGWHMENLLAAVPMVQAQKLNGSAIRGDLRFPMIACVDIAERAAEHLLRRDFTGHTVEALLGPEDRSMQEATRALGEALGIQDLPYLELPPEGVKAALQGSGMSEEFASLLVDSQIALNQGRILEGVERTPDSTTPTRLEAFLKEALGR